MVCLLFSFLILLIYLWLLFTYSVWMFYFGMELQWMIFMIMFLIDCSIYRGLFNYLMLNCIIGILLMIGMLFINGMIYISGIFGKIGYFPYYSLLSSLWHCSSYIFLIFDLINKWSYSGNFLVIYYYSYWFILFNLLLLFIFIKLMVGIKQMLLMSSLMIYLFIICLILVNEYLFSFSILSFYSSTIAVLMFMFHVYGSINIFSYFLYLLTDLIKVFIIIISMLLILYWLIVFSFFPTTMFLIKFFSFIILINYSLSMSFNLTFLSQSLFQLSFLRSLTLLF